MQKEMPDSDHDDNDSDDDKDNKLADENFLQERLSIGHSAMAVR